MQLMDIRDRLKKNLAVAMQALSDQLSAGRPVDYPAYTKLVGRIKGLRDAMDVIDQTFNKIIDEDQDDKAPNAQGA